MEIVKQPSKQIYNLVNILEHDGSKQQRWLKYVLKVKLKDGKTILANLLNKCVIALDSSEIAEPFNIKELRDLLFIVDDDYPEYKVYQHLLSYNKRDLELDLFTKLHSYTVLSTTKCNARCAYCYEKGIVNHDDMDDSTLESLEKLIKMNWLANKKKVQIKMFGGEPFVNQRVFDKIFKFLASEGIEYTSDFISNGYLINDKLIKKMKDEWHTTNGQVTIDGTEEAYNRIKNYKGNPKHSPYKRVISNIHKLIDSGMYINIRINFDMSNCDDVINCLKELVEEFKDKKHCNIYTHHLEGHYTRDVLYKLEDEYRKQDEILGPRNKRYKRKKQIEDRIEDSVCMADSIESVIILPNGDLTKCEDLPLDGYIANINTLVETMDQTDAKGIFIDKYLQYHSFDECKSCNLCPVCLRLKICKKCVDDACDPLEKRHLLKETKRRTIGSYSAYLKQQSSVAS